MPPGDAVSDALLTGAWLAPSLLAAPEGRGAAIELLGPSVDRSERTPRTRIMAGSEPTVDVAHGLPGSYQSLVSSQGTAREGSAPVAPGGSVLWAGASASAVWARELDPLANLDLLVHELGSHRGAFLPSADSPPHDSPDGVKGKGSAVRSPALDAGSTGGPGAPTTPGQTTSFGQSILEALAGQQIPRSAGNITNNQNQNSPPPPPQVAYPCGFLRGTDLLHSKTVPTDGTSVYTNMNQSKWLRSDTEYTLVAHGTFTTQYNPPMSPVTKDAEYYDLTNPQNLDPNNVDIGIKVTGFPAATGSPVWGAYRADHTYYITGFGGDTYLGFSYFDSQSAYPYNVGTLTVDVYCGVLLPPAIPTKCQCGQSADLIDSSSSQTGGNAPDDSSSGPVRYADGTVQMAATDLSSGGFGIGWGQTRTWTNNQYYGPTGNNGTGNVDAQLPYLLTSDSTNYTLAVVSNGTTARFFDMHNGVYVPRFFDQDHLTAGSLEYILTDTKGDQLHFFSFDSSIDPHERGQLKYVVDPDGNQTMLTYDGNSKKVTQAAQTVNINGTVTTDTYLYSYIPVGQMGYGLLANVTLQQTVGSTITTVRQVNYTYYNPGDSYGNAGDLKTVTILDSSNNVLDSSYYRYYTPSDADYANGYRSGLKMVFNGPSYARLQAAVSNPFAAADTVVRPYADVTYQYNSQHQVSDEVVQGAGNSQDPVWQGRGHFTFTYTDSGNALNYNAWATETVETLPDGNENIVFTNGYGQVMVHDFLNPANPAQQWVDYYKYDNSGRLLQHAYPSAIQPDASNNYYNSSSADLMVQQTGGRYMYLKDSAGLVETTTYYTSTTAGEPPTSGSVAGYVQYTMVQQGELGTAILQSSTDYFAHTGGGATVYPVADTTVYGLDHGTASDYSDRDPRKTTYTYSWFPNSTQTQSMQTTLPVVSPTQNGPPAPTVAMTSTFYDQYGRAIWTMDAGGFIGYTAYDQATGAVTKTIQDVKIDAQHAPDYDNQIPPSGWATPANGGLHLITRMTVDTLGRTTKLTDPKGNVTYTVYLDAAHAVRTYHGWVDPMSGNPYATGPTQVSQEVWPAAGSGNPLFDETLSTSTPPAFATGGDGKRYPTGGETITIGDIQSWSRQYTNNAGQVVRTDSYFNKTGIAAFSTAPYLPTNNPGQSSNYYTSYTDYDSRGRASRQQSATGTIQRTVYDGLGRVVSTWVGTNDTTTTQVDLSSAFGSTNGRTGIIPDNTAFSPTGGLEGNGHAYSATLLTSPVTWNTLPFALGPANANDAVVAAGQAVSLPAVNATALSFLATGVNGNQPPQTFIITYTDNSTQTFTQALSDWRASQTASGESRAVTMAYRNNADGSMDSSQPVYLYGYSFTLDPTRQVQSLTLPSNGNVVLLAATLTNAVWSTANTLPSNMVQRTANVYDSGGVGDSTLTQATQFVIAGDTTTARVTQSFYDWRDRLVASKSGVGPVQANEDTTTHRPLLYQVLDNLGEVTEHDRYDADQTTINGYTNGVPNPPQDATRLRAKTLSAYDDQGRVYQQIVYNVSTSGLTTAFGLTTNRWYDLRGNLIKDSEPGGRVTKTQYDGAGRPTVTYTTDGLEQNQMGTSWDKAQTIAGDHVLEQTETTYDTDGNPTLVTTRDRFHNATATGALQGPTATGPNARVSYVATYYDAANRTIGIADFGTNAAMGPPSVGALPPAPSDTVLVTKTGYLADTLQTVTLTGGPTGGNFKLLLNNQASAPINFNASATDVKNALNTIPALTGNVLVTGPAGTGNTAGGPWTVRFTGSLAGTSVTLLTADPSGLMGGTMPNVAIALLSQAGDAGRAQQVTDPRGLVQKADYDLLGRSVRTVQAFSNAAAPPANSNITTESTFDGDNHQLTLQADLANGSFQRTQYNYGVSTPIHSTDILASMQYPDKTSGLPSTQVADQESYSYNVQGDRTGKTDRNGTMHVYSFDSLGRQTVDAVTIPMGSQVDTAVQRLETAYDSYGNPYQFTSFNATSGGSMVNQVQRLFNGFGQVTAEIQNHGGTIPSYYVQYTYSNLNPTSNYSRLVSLTYPNNGRVLTYTYGASGSLDDQISRLTAISDSSGTLESYTDNSGVSAYLGLNTVVQRSHPEASLNLTYYQSGGSGDAGDQYVGLDRFGRVVNQLWVQNGTATDSFQYGYDRDSNRVYRDNLLKASFGEIYHTSGVVDTFDGSGNLLTLGYDPVNEITQFNRGTLTADKTGIVGTATLNQQWGYDALGNWTSFINGGTPDNRTHNHQNQITSMNCGGPCYDNNGNTIAYVNSADGLTRNLVYDAWNRLVKVTSGANTLAVYSYDALGRRIQEVETNSFGDAVTRDLYFSAQWQVLEERESSTGHYTNLVRAQYVWSPVYVDALVERDRDPAQYGSGMLSERFYVQQDANWNVTALVSRTGMVAERYVYSPFGTATVYDAGWNNALSGSQYAWVYLHQGGRFDSAAALYNFRNRDYSPALGRWIQLDPVGFRSGDMNFYRAVGNNPATLTDSSGLAPKLTYTVVQKATALKDGAFEYKSRWEVNPASPKCGLILQRVDYSWVVEDKNGKMVNPDIYFVALNLQKTFNTKYYPYMEAWTVDPNQTETTVALDQRKKGNANPFDDFISSPSFNDPKKPTKGTLIIMLDARFYEGMKVPGDFKVTNSPPAGSLPAKLGLKGKDDQFPKGETSKVTRQFQITWDSTKGPVNSTVKDFS